MANEAWTRADALPPRPEPSFGIEQMLALGSQSENREHWSLSASKELNLLWPVAVSFPSELSWALLQ